VELLYGCDLFMEQGFLVTGGGFENGKQVSRKTRQTRRTVIRYLGVSSKFGTCTVVSVYGTFVEDKMRRFKGQCANFSFRKCHIYSHDGASANFSTNSHETDNSALLYNMYHVLGELDALIRAIG
jgi:hypothetical protein